MEWKELKIGNLPSDILTGDYEFQDKSSKLKPPNTWMDSYANDIFLTLKNLSKRDWETRYRKVQPKAPTHEEITTKWWKVWDGSWIKVYTYFSDDKRYGILIKTEEDQKNPAEYRSFVSADWFIGKESADTPPEE